MPYYRPKKRPCVIDFGSESYVLDGTVETPVIPHAESCVAAGFWEKSDKPLEAIKESKPAAKPKAKAAPKVKAVAPKKKTVKKKKAAAK